MKYKYEATPLDRFGHVTFEGEMHAGAIYRSVCIENDEYNVIFSVSDEEYRSWHDKTGVHYDKIIAFIEANLQRMIKRPVQAVITMED